MKLFNKIFSFILICWIMILNCPLSLSVNALSSIDIEQTVDEDLKAFQFDYEKYQVDKSLVYRPILINYNESLSPDYLDLFYVYDPNNEFNIENIKMNIFIGSNLDSLGSFKKQITYPIYLAGSNSDKTIKRYAFNGYDEYRLNNKYRKYEILSLGDYEVNSVYLFEDKVGVNYSNCLNLRLEDPHNWSWHFDEDNGWQNFLELFTKKDVLKDQLFYSFYIPNGFTVKNIKSIDLSYKTVYLVGNRYNVADTGITHDYYQLEDNYGPKYYKWDKNIDINSDPSKSNLTLLGSNLNLVANMIPFESITITPSEVTSSGVKHDYTWNTIQNLDSFKKSFGEDSEIYKFASKYYLSNNNSNYWIINYDHFYYYYKQMKYEQTVDDIKYAVNGDKNAPASSFFKYLVDDGNVKFSSDQNMNSWYNYYNFREQYSFDISATSITFEDGLGIVRTVPVSVAPVLNKEGSGGLSELFNLNQLNIIKLILGIVLLIIIIEILAKVFDKIFTKRPKTVIQQSYPVNSKKHGRTKKKK